MDSTQTKENTSANGMPNAELMNLYESHLILSDMKDVRLHPELNSSNLVVCNLLRLISRLGCIEPISNNYIRLPPLGDRDRNNAREGLVGNGLISRQRAVLFILEKLGVNSETKLRAYLAEESSHFAFWLKNQLPNLVLYTSEYVDANEQSTTELSYTPARVENLCDLSFKDGYFDLVCNFELLEHVEDLEKAIGECCRVLKTGGHLVSTFPFDLNSLETKTLAFRDPLTDMITHVGDPVYHNDPIRPSLGSLVYRIPGWDVLAKCKEVGFSDVKLHAVASWKHGIAASDLAHILVLVATR